MKTTPPIRPAPVEFAPDEGQDEQRQDDLNEESPEAVEDA